jgi:transcriptional regulator with XRE-family HTH domain
MQETGTALQIAREKARLSQSEVARRMGKTPSYVGHMEGGTRNPSLRTLAAFADAIGVRCIIRFDVVLTPKVKKQD